MDPIFEKENFDHDNYVKKIVAEKIYASDLVDTKEKLTRNAHQTAEEIKHNVYKNYANFMETAKEVGHLEGKMNQMRQSLDEQNKLLNLFKTLSTNTINLNQQSETTKKDSDNNNKKSSLSILLEQVEGCGLITQKPGRNLLFHSDLDSLHLDDYSVAQNIHAYLLSDALLLTLPQRKRFKNSFYNTSSTPHASLSSDSVSASSSANRLLLSTSNTNKSVDASLSNKNNSSINTTNNNSNNTYQYKFKAFYELHDIKIMNIDDSKEVRNSFQLLKFPEALAFKCANAHLKKEWLENIENAKKQLNIENNNLSRKRSLSIQNANTIHEEEDDNYDSDEDNGMNENKKPVYDLNNLNLANISEYERNKILREIFSDFDILLAQRDFEKAIEMLLTIKHSKNNSILDAVQQLIYKQKETELINILRKDLSTSKERGNNKGVIKTGKRVVNSLIKLKIYDEAIDLFIDYHKHLNAETLKKIKLEESNTIYMNNVLNLFFENLRNSYISFKEAFVTQINYCFSSYISWCDTEIEILIKKLQSQHYLGRHFDLTIENCELIFQKAKQFSEVNSFELTFIFETKLNTVLEATIKEQYEILKDASVQRSKLELDDNSKLKLAGLLVSANFEQNRKVQIDKLLNDLGEKKLLDSYFSTEDQLNIITSSTASALQFSCAVLKFFYDCLRIYYQDINYCIVETFTKLFKFELKLYRDYLDNEHLTKRNNRNSQSNSSDQTTTNSSNGLPKKQDILFNICLIERIFLIIETVFFTKTGVHSKVFLKLIEKFSKSKDDLEIKV